MSIKDKAISCEEPPIAIAAAVFISAAVSSSVSWGNLPVEIQQEAHPGAKQKHSKVEDPSFLFKNDSIVNSIGKPTVSLELEAKGVFRWEDFPLVVASSLNQNMNISILKSEEEKENSEDIVVSSREKREQEQPVILSRKNSRGRNVRFGYAAIREYHLTLGDHPWCASYPVTLDWHYHDEVVVDIDDYKVFRENCRKQGSVARRMSVEQRRTRVAHFMDKSKVEVDVLELNRLRENFEEAKLEYELLEDEDENIVQTPKSTLSRVATVHVLATDQTPLENNAEGGGTGRPGKTPYFLPDYRSVEEDHDQEDLVEISMSNCHVVCPGLKTQIV